MKVKEIRELTTEEIKTILTLSIEYMKNKKVLYFFNKVFIIK